MERDLATGPPTTLVDNQHEAHSPVSWSAIFAGATASLALSIVLVALASGFGLKLSSPWPENRMAAETFTPILGAVLMSVQVIASAFGGYLAGRLRTKWVDVHSHEVHFRDTAHGLLVWAPSTVAGVILVTTVMTPGVRSFPPRMVAATAMDSATDAGFTPAERLRMERADNRAAQVSLFMGIGLLLSAFTAAVAAAIGGLRRDEMHSAYWSDLNRIRRSTAPLGN